MTFILVHRRVANEAVPSPTWVNVANINTVAAALTTGTGSRITLRDGFLLVDEEVSEILEKIRRAGDDR